jgi:hypothetical protein
VLEHGVDPGEQTTWATKATPAIVSRPVPTSPASA